MQAASAPMTGREALTAGLRPWQAWLAPCGLAGLLGLLFVRVIFLGQTFFDSDVAYQDYPWAMILAEHIRRGQLPLWVPELGCGFPLPAASAPGVFYPLNWLLFGLLPIDLGFNLHIVVHLWIAGWGMYGFLRELGVSRHAALLAACAFMLSGPTMARVFQPSLLRSSAWLPIGFWCLQRGTRGSAWWTCGAGVAIGLSWLAGHPQIATYVSIAIISYTIWLSSPWAEALPGRGGLRQAIGQVMIVVGIGMLVGAAQWLPTLGHMPFSPRAGPLPFDQAAGFGLHPRHLITLLVPAFFGFQTPAGGYYWGTGNFWELCIYIGVLPLFLALAAWQRGRWRQMRFFIGLAGLSFLIMLGKYIGLARLLYWFPLFNRFQNPERWVTLLSFAASVFIALGADRLQRDPTVRSWLWRVWVRACVVWVGGLGLLKVLVTWGVPSIQEFLKGWHTVLLQGGLSHRPLEQLLARADRTIADVRHAVSLQNGDFLWSLCLFLCVGWLLHRLASSHRSERILVVALGLIVLDLGVFALRCTPTRPAKPALALPGWLLQLQEDAGDWRLLTLPGVDDPSLVAKQVFSLMPSVAHLPLANPPGGSQGLARNNQLLSAVQDMDAAGVLRGLPVANLMNVKYVLSPSPLRHPQLRLIRSTPFPLYENLSVLPRWYLTQTVRVVPSGDDAGVMSALMDPERTRWEAVIERDSGNPSPVVGAPDRSQGADDAITVHRRDATRQVLEVFGTAPGLLVASETWYPGWIALIDDRRVSIERVNGLFRGVWVPAGRHVVEFRYRPLLTWVGMALSGLSPVFLFLGARWLEILRQGEG